MPKLTPLHTLLFQDSSRWCLLRHQPCVAMSRCEVAGLYKSKGDSLQPTSDLVAATQGSCLETRECARELILASIFVFVFERNKTGCHMIRSRHFWYAEPRTCFNNYYRYFQRQIFHSQYMPDELPFLSVFRDGGPRTRCIV